MTRQTQASAKAKQAEHVQAQIQRKYKLTDKGSMLLAIMDSYYKHQNDSNEAIKNQYIKKCDKLQDTLTNERAILHDQRRNLEHRDHQLQVFQEDYDSLLWRYSRMRTILHEIFQENMEYRDGYSHMVRFVDLDPSPAAIRRNEGLLLADEDTEVESLGTQEDPMEREMQDFMEREMEAADRMLDEELEREVEIQNQLARDNGEI